MASVVLCWMSRTSRTATAELLACVMYLRHCLWCPTYTRLTGLGPRSTRTMGSEPRLVKLGEPRDPQQIPIRDGTDRILKSFPADRDGKISVVRLTLATTTVTVRFAFWATTIVRCL